MTRSSAGFAILRRVLLGCALLLGLVASATAADWRATYPELTFGVASVDSLATTASRWDPLGAYLTKALGVPTRMRYATDYAGIIEAVRAGQIQGAHFGAAQYALLFKTSGGNAEPLVKEINAYGTPGYQSIIIVRADSGLNSVEGLKGRTLAFPDPNSTSGYVVPTYLLGKLGYMKPGFFGRTGFAGNHEQAILAVANKTYDAAATFRYSDAASQPSRLVEKGMIPAGAVRAIWNSDFIPDGPFAIRKELPAALKAELATAFIRMPADVMKAVSAGQWKGWEPASHDLYRQIIEILEANEAARRKRP
jgi:phosphonate transport system substrate-binding protein